MTEERAASLINALHQIAQNLTSIEQLLESKLGGIDTGVTEIGQALRGESEGDSE